MNDEVKKKLQEFKEAYLKKLETIIVEFDDFLQQPAINIEEIYKKVHAIAGTSGMYGLKDISDISNTFEVYLKEKNVNPDVVEQKELREKLFEYKKCLESAIIGE